MSKTVSLTDEEKARFSQWLIENIDETVVPGDEGNGDALVYNLVQCIRIGDVEQAWTYFYRYLPEQDRELKSWDRG